MSKNRSFEWKDIEKLTISHIAHKFKVEAVEPDEYDRTVVNDIIRIDVYPREGDKYSVDLRLGRSPLSRTSGNMGLDCKESLKNYINKQTQGLTIEPEFKDYEKSELTYSHNKILKYTWEINSD
ncbi:MAG: hypothetical protein GF308_16740 [Candidatus Heimdallarchaeota archaeon]|nr:hypothetical protein [Candidatus Heimdallarchaeota archaeon]